MKIMGIMSYTEFGQMLSLLYISDHKDEWDDDSEPSPD